MLKDSNHFPHLIDKKQYKLEEKVDSDKEIKTVHKVNPVGINRWYF